MKFLTTFVLINLLASCGNSPKPLTSRNKTDADIKKNTGDILTDSSLKTKNSLQPSKNDPSSQGDPNSQNDTDWKSEEEKNPEETNVVLDPNKSPVMCAEVLDKSKKSVISFCETGGLSAACIGLDSFCTNEDSLSIRQNDKTGLAKFPWYQAAIFWARKNNQPHVKLSSGIIKVSEKSQLVAGGRTTGLLVPSHINLQGSTDKKNPTVLVQADQKRIFAMITVSEDMYESPEKDIGSTNERIATNNVQISYLQISGVDQPPQNCSTASYDMNSIEEINNIPNPQIFSRDKIQAYWGIWIDRTNGEVAPVSVDHVVLAHLENGITFGWASYGMNGDSQCKPSICVKLNYVPASGTTCRVGNFAHLDVANANMCIVESVAPNCAVNHCKMAKFEYTASNANRGHFQNSTICDVDTGLSAAYASHLNISKNLILGVAPTANNNTNAGIWTYRDTEVSHNYVTGGDYSLAAEGSIFPYFDEAGWKGATGWSPYDKGISAVDYQVLGQYITVEANKFFLKNEPYGEYGQNMRAFKNKLLDFTHSGVTLVRQNSIWIGENTIMGRGAKASHSGVQMLDVIGSSIYGNNISQIGSGIWIYGSPGVNSVLGSVNNTCNQNYNIENNTFTNYPNQFANYSRIWEIGPSASCNH